MTICARLAVFAVVFGLAVSLGVYSLPSGIGWEASIRTVGFWPWCVVGTGAADAIALVWFVIGTLLIERAIGVILLAAWIISYVWIGVALAGLEIT